MDYKQMVLDCIARIPDDHVVCLKKLYAIAKKENCRNRCAPTSKPDKHDRDKLNDDLIGIIIRDRFCR